ncbi:uncharacterized protein LOC132884533 [Neoarius graeffei]|uniref:uncharacterized protein LOC132884533 n=1 Tax=Neoarius graeffei TaxID=443677 RepID=UPI00298D49BF|nr:uncharacterized protein LOC132884533 [Neoarius graeffei]
MIRELTVQDTGTYHCGVDRPAQFDIYTAVELKVKEDLSYEKSISETVHIGGDLNIRCKYPESLRSDPKFLCKKTLQQAACFNKGSVKESRKYVNEGKFSLYDDRAKQIFTVGIRNVTEQDSGEYWCGAEGAGTSDHGYKVYFTQINLRATDPSVLVSVPIPAQPSSSSSSSSSSSELTSASPPTGFPASTVIPVSVILLLFLFGIIFLIAILSKRHRMQGTASIDRCSVQGSRNDQQVYENVNDTRHLSASDAGTSRYFSSVKLPTISSDPSESVYANVM